MWDFGFAWRNLPPASSGRVAECRAACFVPVCNLRARISIPRRSGFAGFSPGLFAKRPTARAAALPPRRISRAQRVRRPRPFRRRARCCPVFRLLSLPGIVPHSRLRGPRLSSCRAQTFFPPPDRPLSPPQRLCRFFARPFCKKAASPRRRAPPRRLFRAQRGRRPPRSGGGRAAFLRPRPLLFSPESTHLPFPAYIPLPYHTIHYLSREGEACRA